MQGYFKAKRSPRTHTLTQLQRVPYSRRLWALDSDAGTNRLVSDVSAGGQGHCRASRSKGPLEEGGLCHSWDWLAGCLGGLEGPAQIDSWNVGECVSASPRAGS